MNRTIPAALAVSAAALSPVPGDKLAELRSLAREARDLELEIADLEENTKRRRAELRDLQHSRLPDLMAESGVFNVGIAAEGNLPAYEAKLGAFYRAVIAAEWTPDRREAAYDWLEEAGHGDLIKSEVVVQFNREDLGKARVLLARKEKLGLQPSLTRGVNWNTLTAWLREEDREAKTAGVPLRDHLRAQASAEDPLATLGAEVGFVVKLKAVK